MSMLMTGTRHAEATRAPARDEERWQAVQRRDAALGILRAQGIKAVPPKGAFYLLIDISPAGLPSGEFALRLLKERNIAVAPGSAFGETIDSYVRVSLASALSDLQTGLTGLCAYVNELHRSA